ncbi:MAG: RNA-binding S4 domain-containing protein [Acholeplasmataceae bacterium]|nr:RNA-binding S4 domain-containing protein [Acholeplasmataceae bacterium]HOA63537.1 RNA-binding S4 domain-containing protein [Bacilli bacterium]HPT89446.1 RNA-binding S4 domain-containing protein [Bacilli bacterium]HQA19468.1 RNA-binding S4 domain-containing protein [Bacilli bacterium]HQD91978.1 RNA-binding S4 domain-containing protein [Bacilli bacterium]
MRLDKFLKVSRIIKRRTVAKEVTLDQKILVNGKVAKPSTMLKVGDIVEICFYNKTVVVKVLALNLSTKKQDAESMYEIISVNEE